MYSTVASIFLKIENMRFPQLPGVWTTDMPINSPLCSFSTIALFNLSHTVDRVSYRWSPVQLDARNLHQNDGCCSDDEAWLVFQQHDRWQDLHQELFAVERVVVAAVSASSPTTNSGSSSNVRLTYITSESGSPMAGTPCCEAKQSWDFKRGKQQQPWRSSAQHLLRE